MSWTNLHKVKLIILISIYNITILVMWISIAAGLILTGGLLNQSTSQSYCTEWLVKTKETSQECLPVAKQTTESGYIGYIFKILNFFSKSLSGSDKNVISPKNHLWLAASRNISDRLFKRIIICSIVKEPSLRASDISENSRYRFYHCGWS